MASRWPSWPQLGLKMAILAPTWGILAPSWLQLGPILAQFGEILADPSPAKIDQNLPGQLLRDFSPPGRPQELPDPLQTSIFQVFGTIFKTFSLIFRTPFYRCRFKSSSGPCLCAYVGLVISTFMIHIGFVPSMPRSTCIFQNHYPLALR